MNFCLLRYSIIIFLIFILCDSFVQLSQSTVPGWVISLKSSSIFPDLEEISDGYYFESCEYQVKPNINTRFYRDIKVVFDNAGTESAGQIKINFKLNTK